jgi:hypothetical protein
MATSQILQRRQAHAPVTSTSAESVQATTASTVSRGPQPTARAIRITAPTPTVARRPAPTFGGLRRGFLL